MARLFGKEKQPGNDFETAKAASDRISTEGHGPTFGGLGYDPVGGKAIVPSIERIDLGDVPGGSLSELACARPLHSEPRAVNEVLADAVERVVTRISSGELDYQAVEVIDAWYGEIARLAALQTRKEGLRAEAVLRAKRAADAARRAVDEERSRREAEIRARCRTV